MTPVVEQADINFSWRGAIKLESPINYSCQNVYYVPNHGDNNQANSEYGTFSKLTGLDV